ncbi:PREDICTED: LOW QUALITY PROTEIN: oxysterol-binding protein-related protein 4B-like [Tarenaya hassleriana]|uniref:LOW QUALITY PROTEIN: oxysterol-binding protein-related protein 4B-like n=1 Tax=Tarenaya hassleriana TaxID=28532 RepID=UPI00053C3AB1|nr:PREDICTED: LOW QUALITY PROTEIN: oxysterol-binding protein-related protein 4B-like [Tarenaya hassleriana]
MEEGTTKEVVIAKLYSLEDEEDSNYTASNLIRRILSLFKNVRPGSDLTHFQLPPHFNIPRSQLQCYGEMVYSFGGQDLLGQCNGGDRQIERLKSVVTWNISTLRPLIFGMAPYNPVLGETHHVSHGNIHVLVEQVSHHPPVTASTVVPRFRGAYMEAEVKGKRTLKLLNRGETYEMNSPNLVMRFLPVTRAYWAGKVRIKCLENDLEAELHLATDSLMGIRGNDRSIKGKIYDSSSGKKLYEIYGHWDTTVMAKDLKNGKLEVMYNATENLTGLKTPIVKDLKEVGERESTAVWSQVSKAIMEQDWEKARAAKTALEEIERESRREKEASGKTWVPRHFSVVRHGKDWSCSPLHPTISHAPITVPHL